VTGHNLKRAANAAPRVRPVARMSVTDSVFQEIRRSILSGDLRPGEEFSQRKLAESLDVSFIPVREALRRLEGQGLVVNGQGKSSRVAPLSHDDLHGIYRLRRQLEPEIASRACALLSPAELDRLVDVAHSFADEEANVDDVYEAHHEFHRALLAPAATAWDLSTLETLWRAAERYIRLAFSARDDDPHEHRNRSQAHGELVDAYRSQDPELVQAATLAHLDHNESIAHGAIQVDDPALG
jgi:DNA-binding GntR family transcriptional regulator